MDLRSNNAVIVDTLPANARGQNSINLGLEIIERHLDAPVIHWRDKLDADRPPNTIYFNVIYSPHVLNAVSFLHRNRIRLRKAHRRYPRIIFGGQGASNMADGLSEIADLVFLGEIEGYFKNSKDSAGWWRAPEIDSKLSILDSRAVIELTRGCKYRCKFCEYGWALGGKYREKSPNLVMDQIDEAGRCKVKNINFMSANFAGYSQIGNVLEYCQTYGIRVTNTDASAKDIPRILPHLDALHLPVFKIGVESWDEKTRRRMGKGIGNKELEDTILWLCQTCSYLHFYLIFGLPGDDHGQWFLWLERLAKIRKGITDRAIRFEFNITNFEPCLGTPMARGPWTDFKAKDQFLKRWFAAMKKHGFLPTEKLPTYANFKGRIGRKELTYRMLMELKTAPASKLTPALQMIKKGVGRSIPDRDAWRFLSFMGWK